jgi:hypothetical protein
MPYTTFHLFKPPHNRIRKRKNLPQNMQGIKNLTFMDIIDEFAKPEVSQKITVRKYSGLPFLRPG